MTREERIEAIRDGVKDGMSASQIAEVIGGCSRNSVIGLANRTKIVLANAKSMQNPRAKTEKKVKPSKPPSVKVGKEKEERSVRAPDPLAATLVLRRSPAVNVEPVYEFPDIHYRIHLEEVKSGQCRRPTWNDDRKPNIEVYFFCGKPVKSGSPYCWHCHKKMYDGMPAQRREKKRSSARLTRRGDFE